MPFRWSAPHPVRIAGRSGQQETQGVSFTTDASGLQRLGIECGICGPGSIETAHRPNEYLPIAEFVAAGEQLRELVATFTARR